MDRLEGQAAVLAGIVLAGCFGPVDSYELAVIDEGQATAIVTRTFGDRVGGALIELLGLMIVMLAIGCVSGWKVRGEIDKIAKRLEAPMMKKHEEQVVQTVELGLVREVPQRTFNSSQWAQRCQRCLEPINQGEPIAKYGEGWCHTACRFRPVARGP